MGDIAKDVTGKIRAVELSRVPSAFRPKRLPKSIVAGAGAAAPAPVAPSGYTVDSGLILALYNVAEDAQPSDSVRNEGGALILHAHLELVFWGTAWQQPSTSPSVGDVVTAVDGIVGSPYLLGLKQYGFQDAVVRGATIVTSPSPPAAYTFDEVGNLVWSLIDDGKFPEPDDDSGRILYMVFMPPGTTPPPNIRGAHSDPSDFDLPADVDYAWVGFVSYGSLDYISSVFSHEFVEAITDPEPHDPAWLMNRNINGGDEIGDACNNTTDQLGGIRVQAYWSQRQQACVIPKGQGTLPSLHSLEQGLKLESGTAGTAYVSLDESTPIDVTVSLTSDNPAVLTVPDSLTIPTGNVGGRLTLDASAVEGPTQVVTIGASYSGKTLTAQVWVTPRPSSLAGVVTSADTGEPIDAAIMVIDGPASAGVHAEHLQLGTGPNGSYATPSLTPGSYTIEGSASGYVPVTTNVTVSEGVATTRANIALPVRHPFTVRGAVTDRAHAPLPGVSVTLVGEVSLRTTTDSTGTYSLSLDPGQYTGAYGLYATLAGYVDGHVDLASIPNGATLSEAFVLLAFGTLTGRITDAGATPATPIVGALVTAGPASSTTDATGRYTLQQLTPGPTTVTVTAHGFERAGPTTTSVAEGATLTQDFALIQASATLTGTISDAENPYPISGALVSVTGATPRESSSNGTYTIGNIPAGLASITTTARGYDTIQFTTEFAAHETITRDFGLYMPRPPGPVT